MSHTFVILVHTLCFVSVCCHFGTGCWLLMFGCNEKNNKYTTEARRCEQSLHDKMFLVIVFTQNMYAFEALLLVHCSSA
jgi:hypothetical protein